jgi:hypothetical protein
LPGGFAVNSLKGEAKIDCRIIDNTGAVVLTDYEAAMHRWTDRSPDGQKPAVSELVTSKQGINTLQGGGGVNGEGSP